MACRDVDAPGSPGVRDYMLVKFQQRYQTRQAISLIPFDRLNFRTLGYPQNRAPFSPPILGVEFRCCLAASRPRSHTRRASLDGLPQHRIVGDLENEQRFRDLPEGLQHPIEGVLFRVRVEPAKQVRGRHFLEFDGCDHAQDFVPLLNHNLLIRIASGLDLPGGTVYPLAVPENIESLALELL